MHSLRLEGAKGQKDLQELLAQVTHQEKDPVLPCQHVSISSACYTTTSKQQQYLLPIFLPDVAQVLQKSTLTPNHIVQEIHKPILQNQKSLKHRCDCRYLQLEIQNLRQVCVWCMSINKVSDGNAQNRCVSMEPRGSYNKQPGVSSFSFHDKVWSTPANPVGHYLQSDQRNEPSPPLTAYFKQTSNQQYEKLSLLCTSHGFGLFLSYIALELRDF